MVHNTHVWDTLFHHRSKVLEGTSQTPPKSLPTLSGLSFPACALALDSVLMTPLTVSAAGMPREGSCQPAQ